MTIAGWSRAAGCVLLFAALAGCGGGSDESQPTPPPPAPSGIGAAGGTVTSGAASVVIPAGALSGNVDIAVAQTATGAPALPAGVTAAGQIYAFTPHGTTFASPVTITVPFDPTLVPAGGIPVLYKTDATQTTWSPVAGATVSGSAMSGAVTGFSYVVVAPQPPEGFPGLTEKSWSLDANKFTATGPVAALDQGTQTGGLVNRTRGVGLDLIIHPPNPPSTGPALVGAHSSENGKTFWTLAQAPRDLPGTEFPLDTSQALLKQVYTFKVRDPSAKLTFLVTHSFVELMDDGGKTPSAENCPWLNASDSHFIHRCATDMMQAFNKVTINARAVSVPYPFYENQGQVELRGIPGEFEFGWGGMFMPTDFNVNLEDTYAIAGDYALAILKAPFPIAIPLSSLKVGDVFNVTLTMLSYTRNLVQGESYAAAMMRDPVDFSAAGSIEFTGLEQLPVNHDPLPDPVPLACATPDATAGQFEFGDDVYSTVESEIEQGVEIRRVGGTHGEAVVLLESANGTASAGSDFATQHVAVHFADGEGGSKLVDIPLVGDDVAEEDETATLTLSPFAGCATLAARDSATLEILDDDRAPATYTIGGSITGLAGTGLVLRNNINGNEVAASGTSFQMPDALPNGGVYDVVITAQPGNPAQSCTISNGSGSVASANVTNIAVTCVSALPSGSLDPSFGEGGRATTNVNYGPALIGARIGMALQPDGKILMVGGLKLLRFNADGSLDSGFGTAGVATVVFNRGSLDTAMDVAVQADGKILVAGSTNAVLIGSDDFVLERFNANGTIDTSFGTAGKVVTDFYGNIDRVRRMQLQADGKIVLVGSAMQSVAGVTVTEFAVARYNTDGTPDTSFSDDGKTADSPGNSYSIARGLTLYDDGKILLAGSSASSGTTDPDAGFVRYLANGRRDTSFGFGANGVLLMPMGDSAEVVDVVTRDDGEILGATRYSVGSGSSGGRAFGFAMAHAPADGVAGPRVPQPLTTLTTESDDPRSMLKQPDGKIVVVGQSAALSTNSNMAVVRYVEAGGALDTSFGTDGKLTVDFFGGRDAGEAVVQQPDGRLVIGGYARSGNATVFALTRLAQ